MAFATPLDRLVFLEEDFQHRCMASRMEKGKQIGIKCLKPVDQERLRKAIKEINSITLVDVDHPEMLPKYTQLARLLICPIYGHETQIDEAVDFWRSEVRHGKAAKWAERRPKNRATDSTPVITHLEDANSRTHPSLIRADADKGDRIEEIVDELSSRLAADKYVVILLAELKRLLSDPIGKNNNHCKASPSPKEHQSEVKREPCTSSKDGPDKTDISKSQPLDHTQQTGSRSPSERIAKKCEESGLGDSAVSESSFGFGLPSTKSSAENENDPLDDAASPTKSLGSLTNKPSSVSTNTRPITRSVFRGETMVTDYLAGALPPFYDYRSSRRTQRQVDLDLMERIMKPISGRDTKSGYVYIFTRPDLPGLVKIGVTTHTVEARLRDIRRDCRFPLMVVDDPRQRIVPNVFRVEGLVHRELALLRKKERRCQGCGVGHEEWFEVGKEEALLKLECWRKWIEKKPYKENSLTLKSKWKTRFTEKLFGVAATTTKTAVRTATTPTTQTTMATKADRKKEAEEWQQWAIDVTRARFC